MVGENAEEPDDLYRLRIAAHECATALYEYIRFAITFASAAEDPEFEQFKGKVFEGSANTPEDYLKDDFETPIMRLQVIIGSLMIFVNKLIDKHRAFSIAFDPLEDELAAVYPGLQAISGATGRSHCKALESFTWHVVRYTFDATAKFTPESELDPTLSQDEPVPFTPSNWHPAIKQVLSCFDAIDVEDHVHEAIEQEIADAWRNRGRIATNNQSAASHSVADNARRVAERIGKLTDEIIDSFKLPTALERANHINGITGEISHDLFPVLTWIERNRPQAASLEKQRLFQMQDTAAKCAEVGHKTTGGAEFLVFCKMFGSAILGWAQEIDGATGAPQGAPAEKPTSDRAKLGKKQLAALEIIEKEGPILGKALAKRVCVQFSTLRKHILPKLKPFGLKNDGQGYYV